MPDQPPSPPAEDIEQAAQPRRLLDMDASVLSQVHFVGNRINASGSAAYRKWFGIGIAEFRLLVIIANEPGLTGARIHEILGLDLGAISRTLRKLQQQKLVVSKAHARHPSYRCWYLSTAGADLHDRICAMTDTREAAILEGFSKAEIYQLLSFLHRLSANAVRLKQITDSGAPPDASAD